MHKLDKKDAKILEMLKDHGDASTRDIAKKTLLPISTVNNRIRKLKQEKIIQKVTIEVDPHRTGKGFAAYVLMTADIQTLKQKHKTQYDIIQELKKYSFVERADVVSGGTDIVVFIRVKDVQEFDQVLLGKMQLIEGVEKTQSLIVIH
ncbi:MAG TPA: Lrp/AsnC family transcriptional regulator [Candidatus Nanoarchaeia archaeon]|nr:Lrp/AsnC family transcriptional regulator [Candidatus Nanoarchaeia archaeon]